MGNERLVLKLNLRILNVCGFFSTLMPMSLFQKLFRVNQDRRRALVFPAVSSTSRICLTSVVNDAYPDLTTFDVGDDTEEEENFDESEEEEEFEIDDDDDE